LTILHGEFVTAGKVQKVFGEARSWEKFPVAQVRSRRQSSANPGLGLVRLGFPVHFQSAPNQGAIQIVRPNLVHPPANGGNSQRIFRERKDRDFFRLGRGALINQLDSRRLRDVSVDFF